MAYQLGRHIIGYEVQKVLSLVDWMSRSNPPIGVIGYGEGGLIGLYSAAVDTRIQATAVSGYFQARASGLARADLPKRLGIATRIWRCRNRESHRTASLDY